MTRPTRPPPDPAAQPAPTFTLDELLAQCEQYDPNVPRSAEDEAWLSAPPVGREIL